MSVDTVLREGVIELAVQAARAIMAVYDYVSNDGNIDVQRKADDSPLTLADLAAHHCIVDGLSRLTPDIPVLSEEAAHETSTVERLRWARLWLVDPLDGTREFVKRNGEFTVNIALIENGVATFGVIQAPVTGKLWWGQHGVGAFIRDGDYVDAALQTRMPARSPMRVAASRSHRDARTETFMARMSAQVGELETIGVGSSLKFCQVAEGRVDVYPRFGPTSEWDTAAGQCIVESAGGRLFDPHGRPFRYNQREILLNGDFVVLGDSNLPWQSWLSTEA